MLRRFIVSFFCIFAAITARANQTIMSTSILQNGTGFYVSSGIVAGQFSFNSLNSSNTNVATWAYSKLWNANNNIFNIDYLIDRMQSPGTGHDGYYQIEASSCAYNVTCTNGWIRLEPGSGAGTGRICGGDPTATYDCLSVTSGGGLITKLTVTSTVTLQGPVIDGSSSAGSSGQFLSSQGAGSATKWISSTGDNLGNHIATMTVTANYGITTTSMVVTSTINVNASTVFGGHIEISSATPTMSSCGTSPSVIGNDVAGTITIGGGVVLSCTLTFAKAWSNAPACTMASSSFITGQAASTTTSALTITGSATFNGDTIMYLCLGQK